MSKLNFVEVNLDWFVITGGGSWTLVFIRGRCTLILKKRNGYWNFQFTSFFEIYQWTCNKIWMVIIDSLIAATVNVQPNKKQKRNQKGNSGFSKLLNSIDNFSPSFKELWNFQSPFFMFSKANLDKVGF